MADKKIKVAVICHLSNADIRAKLPIRMGWLDKLVLGLLRKTSYYNMPDFAVWNSNLIDEISAYTDKIEMHIIAPHKYLQNKTYEFEEKGVYFHFYKSKEGTIIYHVVKNLFPLLLDNSYTEYRSIIKIFSDKIRPDIIHIIGIENPYYATAGLDCPKDIPLMVQLQTLMIDPAFKKNYPITEIEYKHRSGYERQLLERADYICTPVRHFIELIKCGVDTKAEFINTDLLLAEPLNIDNKSNKLYDFVYFSADISKAIDLAIEAFVLACNQIPNLTLNIIGRYSNDLKRQLDSKLEKNRLLQNVKFEGALPTHEDVMKQIRKSRFALLPLKIDFVSGTIRESMANGLPVVTTITAGTPTLNRNKETVLLSPIGDHKALADNMVRLYKDPLLAKLLQTNGAEYMANTFSNKAMIKEWITAYEMAVEKRNKS